MVTGLLHALGLRGWHGHALSLGSVGLCVLLWIRAKTVDQEERGNAERRAIFVGLWAPTLWLVGDGIERRHGLLDSDRGLRAARAGHRLRKALQRVPLLS